ncbi:hypothetical protein LWC34_28520 [Kibdelosporangium philippinense]|uniref:Transposase n=1 Tax=Kibdelosporangium philippinense TaxID=211113 RepID=A0ABS8ZGZ6_9PSEU|nr:hypothetical protein [Kibdelosporangium philippinense]MCE7006742.1 hypothetical protein [Kibdelosporangium philippinense]
MPSFPLCDLTDEQWKVLEPEARAVMAELRKSRPELHEEMVPWATVAIMTRRLTSELASAPPHPRWGQPRQPHPTAA